jgi:hypothetical protein
VDLDRVEVETMSYLGITTEGNVRQRRYFGRSPIALTDIGRKSRHVAQLLAYHNRIAATKPPEGFRPIPGFDNRYSVSADGEVFSHFHGRVMSQFVNRGGYFTVTLSRANSRKRPYEVHALIMLAFVGPVPDGHEVDHMDRVKKHNVLDNLRYVTRPTNGHNALKPKRVNRTPFRGVTYSDRGVLRWCARIRGNKLTRTSQYFATDREAAEAYDSLAEAEFGPTAITNKSLGLL